MRVFTDLHQLPSFRDAVLTIGSFDGVHTGHRRILEQVQRLARACGGESVVLSFEPHPRTVLHPDDAAFKLITTSSEKIALLEQCGVDHVVLAPFTLDFARQSAREYVEDFLIRLFNPRYIVIGYDHRFGANREGNLAFLQAYEAQGLFSIVEIPAQEIDDIAVSSSKIRNALEASDIAYANRLLAHPYFFTGRVVSGNRIGRTIGFPTANIQIADRYKLIPPAGIYAARAVLARPGNIEPFPWRPDARVVYDAMLYIGQRPTLAGGLDRSIEVNLLDFDGDLYGQEMAVELIDFIRPDKKLDGLGALKAQIEADKVEILQRLHPEPHKTPATPSDTAIVILNYNTRRHLAEYLPSVLAHSGGARVIVADNGSPDDSIAFLREQYPQVEILDLQQNYGFAQGYNEALRQVHSAFYVVLNSDVEVTSGWMEPVLDAMRANPRIAIAQPKILAWRDKTRFEYAGAAGGWIDYLGYPFCRGRIFSQNEEDQGQYDTPQECFWAAGAAFFIRAELYHSFGGFDGDYFAHNEEIDLCWRLKRAGYQVWCFPDSVVYHLGGGTLEYESPRKVFLNFRNSLFTLLKNEPAAKLCWLLPARFLLDGLAGLRFALKGQFRAIWAIVEAHFSFYKHWGLTLRKRRQIAKAIEKQGIGPENCSGIYGGSIVFAHYARRIKQFSKLL
ncbi:MAG: riboflavin biosynthesis protein RibF [Saprospiraceae bacterium]|nr:riboflavin biosynthesis protein RibF [Saprospiraceae bacterium]